MVIREAVPLDIDGAMALMNRNASPKKTPEFMKWWNFGTFPSTTFVAEERGELVGMFIVFKRRLTNGLGCGVLMGLVVDPDWRGTGLFGDVGRRAMSCCEDLDVFVCLTNKRGRRALEHHFGFRTIETIETMVSSEGLHSTGSDRGGVFATVAQDTAFDCAKPFRPGTIAFEADEAFRRWRFGLRPDNAPYLAARVDSGDSFIVKRYYHEEKETHYGDIFDFDLHDFSHAGLARLIGSARSMLGAGVEALTMQAVGRSSFYEMLMKIGFVESDMKHFFCMKVKESEKAYLYDPGEWIVKWGDFLR
jgi:GNAT superfamily N-acetyltransferase